MTRQPFVSFNQMELIYFVPLYIYIYIYENMQKNFLRARKEGRGGRDIQVDVTVYLTFSKKNIYIYIFSDQESPCPVCMSWPGLSATQKLIKILSEINMYKTRHVFFYLYIKEN